MYNSYLDKKLKEKVISHSYSWWPKERLKDGAVNLDKKKGGGRLMGTFKQDTLLAQAWMIYKGQWKHL
jgi:hypothetical protein